MDLAELKLISASNIINLRTSAHLTQAELGAKLNYSDKTISKWERGEAIPDAFVLTQMAEIFHVSVDYLLSSHDKWKNPAEEEKASEPKYSAEIIIAITLLSIMTVALTAFVIVWLLFSILEWRVFLVGIMICSIAYLVLDCVFKNARHLKLSLILLIVSVFVLVYFVFWQSKPWQVFLVMAPSIAIALLSTYVYRGPKRDGKIEKQQNS